MKKKPFILRSTDPHFHRKRRCLINEIEQQIEMKQQRVCAYCNEVEWMYPEDILCWRCQRIEQGMQVAKPLGEYWLWWNYRLETWAFRPEEEKDWPEWGRI